MLYRSLRRALARGLIDLESGLVKALLVTARYRPDEQHATVAQVVGEVTGPGYAAGGKALVGALLKPGRDYEALVALDLVWPEASITARGVVVYYDLGDAARSVLLTHADFGTDITSTNGPFTVHWRDGEVLAL